MQPTPTQVECHPGAKADETPRRFQSAGDWIQIGEVAGREGQIVNQPEWPRATCFQVRGAAGCDYPLKHGEEADEWFSAQPWKPESPSPNGNGHAL